MSTEKGTSFTRRTFVKAGAATAGAAALLYAGQQPVLQALAADYQSGQPENSEETICDGVCRPNCFAYCHLNIHVRNGNIVKTSMAPFKDEYYNRICLRGLSHVQRIYDPERVKYPLMRAGERGENKWERISWDEAIDKVCAAFKDSREKYGDQAVAFYGGSGNISLLHGLTPGLNTLLANVINATVVNNSVDAALTVGVNRVAGNFGPWVSNEPRDMVNAKTVVVWGNNITDAQPQEWHCIAEAMEAGAKLVVIDPQYTQIAAKADWWIPVRPGSDPALYLTIMNVILQENAQDEEFLLKNTCAPFLVNSETGLFVRMSELGVEPTEGPVNASTGKPTIIDPVAVWSTGADAPGSVSEVADPALSGAHDVNGVPCKTAFDLLKEEIQQYPPETAADLVDMSAEDIIKLAHICMDGPVFHRVGFGPQAYDNGVHSAHAGMTMCALTGNIGKPGASYGASWNVFPGINYKYVMPTGPSTSLSLSQLPLREIMRSGKFNGKDYPIKSMFIFSGNPVSCAVNTNEFINDVIGNLDFFVVADSMLTDTARWADVVLPVAQWFEQQDITVASSTHYLQYSPKSIEPLYETKPDGDIIRLIAKGLGVEEYFQMSDDEYLTNIIDTPVSQKLGISFEKLKKEQAMRYLPNPFIAWEGNKFYTPSGRMEFYVEKADPRMKGQGLEINFEREHLPRFFPPAEAWPENPLYEKYPLNLISERPRFRVHSQWYNVRWLRELDPEPTVKINPVDAEVRGIESGAYVEAFNDRGHCVAKAVISDGVRPGTVSYPKSWQAHQHKAGCWSELASSTCDPIALNQSFMDNLCEIRLWTGEE